MNPTADQLQQMVQQALGEFERLSRSDQPPSQVLTRMVETITRATEARGAIAWMPAGQESGRFVAAARSGDAAGLAVDAEGAPQPAVQQTLSRTAEQNKPAAVGPDQAQFDGTELHQSTQFYIPIDAAGHVMGVLHVIQPAELDPKVYRQYVAFLQQGARAVGTYLSRRQSQVLQQDAASSAAILRITQKLLPIDEPEALIHELANQARPTLEAQRVAVVGYTKGRERVAFSDAVETNRRAVLVRTAQMLAETVRQRQVPMTFTKGQQLEEEDEALAPLLEQLYELGSAEAVCLTPLRSGDRVVGVMVGEYGSAEQASRRSSVQQTLSQQAGPILDRAIEWQRRPLRRTSNALAKLRRKPLTAAAQALLVLTLLGGAVYGLLFVPVPIPVSADAKLAPAQRAVVSAPRGGRVGEVLVETGDRVDEGQVLLRMDDTELKLQRSQVRQQIAQQRVKLETAREAGKLSDVRSAELRIRELELRLQTLNRKIDRATVRSRISGVVLTERPQQMEGTTLKKGEKLLEVAELSRFDLVMKVREGDLALIERTLRSGQDVPVTFLSRPWPDRSQQTTVENLAAISPTSAPDQRKKQHVFRVTVPIELEGLSPNLVLANPSGRAELVTEQRSVAFRYGRRLWRFIQMTVLF